MYESYTDGKTHQQEGSDTSTDCEICPEGEHSSGGVPCKVCPKGHILTEGREECISHSTMLIRKFFRQASHRRC